MWRAFCLLSLAACFLLVGCNRDPKVLSAKCVANGKKYAENGRLSEAAIMYRRAIQLNRMSAEAHYGLGVIQMRRARYAEAMRSLQRAVDLDPTNEDALVREAQLYLAAYLGNPTANKRGLEEAQTAVNRILKLNPKSFDGVRLSGDLASTTSNYPLAIQKFREANEIKPGQPIIIISLMRNLASVGQLKEAEELGQDLLAHDKTQGQVYDLLYTFALQRKQLDEAERILKWKISNVPSDTSGRIELASLYYLSNRRPEMFAALESFRADRKAFPEADRLIGDFLVRIGEFDRAIEAYREGKKHEPKLSAAYDKRVIEVLVAQGHKDEAMQLAAKVHKDNPKDREAAALNAMLLARGNPQQLDSAIRDLEALVTEEPGNPMLQLNLGRVYEAKGDQASLGKARQHLETSVRLNRDFLPAKLALAGLQMATGQNGEALTSADELLQSSPTNLNAALIRSTALLRMGQLQKARDQLVESLRTHRDSAEVRSRLAWLDLASKRYAESEAEYEELRQAGDPRGVIGLAGCKYAQGKTAEAIQMLQRALDKSPDHDDYRWTLEDLELRSGRFQEARDHLLQLASQKPDSADIQYRLGDVDSRLGDSHGAIECFRKAHQLNPRDPKAALALAVMLDNTGQSAPARAAYEETIKLDPNNAAALNNLAYMNANDGSDLDRALGFAQRAVQLAPDDPNMHDTLGLVYIRKKLTGPALQVLRDLVARSPQNPSFHYHLGMALYDAGEKQKAKKELETALKHKPTPAEEAKIKELAAKIG